MEGRRRSVEEKIRAAQQRGAFDNLPGAGKPLDLGDVNDPNWFVKSLIRREKIDPDTLVHPTVLLRRERDTFPDALFDLRTEEQVRAVLEEFNDRVKAEWRRPQVGRSLPVIARLVAVEPMVDKWGEHRAQLAAEAQAAAAELAAAAEAEKVARRRRRFWRRRRDRDG
jgi:hypothetical protein